VEESTAHSSSNNLFTSDMYMLIGESLLITFYYIIYADILI